MKTTFTILIGILFTFSSFGQTSPLEPVCTVNYQAVARDADDNVMANQDIRVVFTILDGPGANELYIEEHLTTTSSLGLFNLEVGGGDMIGGSMVWDAIPWVIRKHYLRVELDIGNTGNLINAGEAPVLAVPIAIQAKVASIALSVSDTIKVYDTLRVDTIIAKKIKVDSIITKKIKVDTIITKIINVDSINVRKIEAREICADDGIFDIIISRDLITEYIITETLDALTVISDSINARKIVAQSICIQDTITDPTSGEKKVVVVAGFEMFGASIFGSSDPDNGVTHAGYFDGDVEIFDGGFTMRNLNGEVVFEVDEDGNSYHAGLEEFAGGLLVTDPDGNPILDIDPSVDPLSDYPTIFYGNVMINGFLGGLGKNFVIDHPLDPENKSLRHWSVESDQMATLYHGTESFDNNGEAWVELPDWFEALNKDFTYQLTCIGGFSNVYIGEEIYNNRFKIAGGKSGMKVSWQVSGVRKDPQAIQYNLPVEFAKLERTKQKK